MTTEDRMQEMEATLRDIVSGCEMMLQIPLTPSFKAYVLEVKRVANAPLESM